MTYRRRLAAAMIAAAVAGVASFPLLSPPAFAASAVPSSISPIVEGLKSGDSGLIPFAGVRLGWQLADRAEFTLDLTTILLLSNAVVGVKVDVSAASPHPYLYGRGGLMTVTWPGIFEEDDFESTLRLDFGGGLNIVGGHRTAWFIEAGGVTLGRPSRGTDVIFRAATGVRFGL